VYHKQFLSDVLPENHPVFCTALYNSTLCDDLRVWCDISIRQTTTRATGVPPHTMLLLKMQSMVESVGAIHATLAELPSNICGNINRLLQEKAVGYGTVTTGGLETTLTSVLRKTGLLDLVANQVQNYQGTTAAPEPTDSFEEFKLDNFTPEPKLMLLPAWQLWCCGNRKKNYPPYCTISSKQILNKNSKKRFREYRFVMQHIQNIVGKCNTGG
jgi:hypothetical protein